MFNLILENDKNKIFKTFNIFLLVLFAWVIFINTSYFIEKIIFGEHDHFYDLKLVHNSLIGILNGEDIYKIYPPYYDQPRSAFPPYIFYFLKILGKLDWLDFLKCFIFFQILSFISLFYYSYKLYPLDKIKYLYPFIYFFSFNFSIGLGGTVTGNTTVILYGILSLGLIYLFKKRIIIFNLIIFIAALFKFYFLIFYFLPIFLYGLKQIKLIIIFIIFLILINLIYFINEPELFQSWLEYVNIQTSRSGFNPWIGTDITQAFASIVSKLGTLFNINIYPSSLVSNLFYLIITSIIFVSIFFIYNSKNIKKNNENILKMISMGLLTIYVCFPRLMSYDFFLIIPAYYFLIKEINFFDNKNKNFFTKFILFFLFLCVQDSQIGLASFSILFFIICYLEFKNKDPLLLKRN